MILHRLEHCTVLMVHHEKLLVQVRCPALSKENNGNFFTVSPNQIDLLEKLLYSGQECTMIVKMEKGKGTTLVRIL